VRWSSYASPYRNRTATRQPMASSKPAHSAPSDAVESSSVGWNKSGRRTPDPEIPAPIWKASDEEVHVIVEVRPALRSKEFFASLYGLCSEKGALPNPLQIAVLIDEHKEERSYQASAIGAGGDVRGVDIGRQAARIQSPLPKLQRMGAFQRRGGWSAFHNKGGGDGSRNGGSPALANLLLLTTRVEASPERLIPSQLTPRTYAKQARSCPITSTPSNPYSRSDRNYRILGSRPSRILHGGVL
jgi:hypothetical protein